VGEVSGSSQVHGLADVADLSAGRDYEPMIEEGGFGWAVAAVAAESDMEETPVFVGLVEGVDENVVIGVGPGMRQR